MAKWLLLDMWEGGCYGFANLAAMWLPCAFVCPRQMGAWACYESRVGFGGTDDPDESVTATLKSALTCTTGPPINTRLRRIVWSQSRWSDREVWQKNRRRQRQTVSASAMLQLPKPAAHLQCMFSSLLSQSAKASSPTMEAQATHSCLSLPLATISSIIFCHSRYCLGQS